MKALGLIETKGLVVAIESADAMLKAAEVSLVEKKLVGGGLVTITITGEVAAVKAAVDAGAAAVENLCQGLLISQHVIPRPHDDLMLIVPIGGEEDASVDQAPPQTTIQDTLPIVEKEGAPEPAELVEVNEIPDQTPSKKVIDLPSETDWSKDKVDRMAADLNVEDVLEELTALKVVQLRTLARQYETLGILGREISKADKKMLLDALKQYYINIL